MYTNTGSASNVIDSTCSAPNDTSAPAPALAAMMITTTVATISTETSASNVETTTKNVIINENTKPSNQDETATPQENIDPDVADLRHLEKNVPLDAWWIC